jgi:hypothetical protein
MRAWRRNGLETSPFACQTSEPQPHFPLHLFPRVSQRSFHSLHSFFHRHSLALGINLHTTLFSYALPTVQRSHSIHTHQPQTKQPYSTMFSKTTLFLAFTAIASVASAASPPGCLLGAVNSYSTPYDISSVCKQKDVTDKISKVCGDASKDALDAFAEICNKAGVKVGMLASFSTSMSLRLSVYRLVS